MNYAKKYKPISLILVMADKFDAKTRSKIMSSIKSSGTKPEIKIKKSIRGLGFSYQPKMKGSPDFVNKKARIALYLQGCFWHACPKHYKLPKTNKDYWSKKIKRNLERDKKNFSFLKKKGYKIIKIWECDALKSPEKAKDKIMKLIKK